MAVTSFGGNADPESQALIAHYEFRDMEGAATGVYIGMIILFRTLQVIFLKKLNNIER